MQGRRDSSSTIWRTVVFAGAMLGCGGPAKPAPTAPQNTAPATTPTPEPAATPTTANGAAPTNNPATGPTADPCNGVVVPPQTAQPNPTPVDDPLEEAPPPPKGKRPRGGGDRPTGRGFVLA
jgi:hypothetical protein